MTDKYSCFDLEIKNKVAYVTMCRPDEYNTMNKAFWSELPHLVEKISDDAQCEGNCVVLYRKTFLCRNGFSKLFIER